jgi:NhaP-type Na+/H+ or K+/H+ antiporter
MFWVSAFAWAVVKDPPPLMGVMTSAALATTIIVFVTRRAWSRGLVAPNETEFTRLLVRFTTAAFGTYTVLWGGIIGAGTAALWLLPPPAGSEAGIGVAILAWWAPIWISPVPAAFLAARWSTKDAVPRPGVTEG